MKKETEDMSDVLNQLYKVRDKLQDTFNLNNESRSLEVLTQLGLRILNPANMKFLLLIAMSVALTNASDCMSKHGYRCVPKAESHAGWSWLFVTGDPCFELWGGKVIQFKNSCNFQYCDDIFFSGV